MSNPFVVKVPLEDRIRCCIERHPDWGVSRITDAIHGATAKMVWEAKAKMSGTPLPPPQRETSALVSLDTLKAKFDTVGAIRRELSKLPRGKLIPEQELRQLACGFDSARFRRTLENNIEEFQACRIKVRTERDREGKWFWGHPDDVAELDRAISA